MVWCTGLYACVVVQCSCFEFLLAAYRLLIEGEKKGLKADLTALLVVQCDHFKSLLDLTSHQRKRRRFAERINGHLREDLN
ncbi:hypothetical protein FH972_002026 [Carpinus fangiana]|uniref:Uncharacterized protein n=1 Tax=Carpinus fangiana TaxID=176857 RepID=A0A5N6QE34_9ROSI|nr:hypothetical protein FH972_002026 [Carpinus fangiana]